MTYGSAVQVYELGFNYFPKLHFFDAKKCAPLHVDTFSYVTVSYFHI